MRPIIVVGTGRSGTSTTARILHQRLGVCMGHSFPTEDELNPQGYWEDEALRGKLTILAIGRPPAEEWLKYFRASHVGCTSVLWGYKHPKLATLSRAVWEALRPLLVIKATRPFGETLMSVRRYAVLNKRNRRLSDDQRRNLIRVRNRAMRVGLKRLHVVEICYDRQLSDDEVEAILRPHVDEVRSKLYPSKDL